MGRKAFRRTRDHFWRRRFDAAPRDDREKGRQLRFLLSRGYSHGIAFKVLKAAEARVDDPVP